MPAILTHKAIMLLARERVQDIRDRLLLKKASGRPITDLELRVLRLASLTHIAMSDADETREQIETPSEADWPDGFGKGVSRFSVMGSMGPDIPGLAALLAPAQAVWFDTVHKGTPDANREQINARTTDLALEIWKQGSHALSDRPTGGPDAAKALDRARSQLRAYVLGHLCHIVGDVIAHPFVNDVEWHVPPRETSKLFAKFPLETLKFTHQKTEGSLDTRVAIEMFRRKGPREGQDWSAWWPTVDEVPPELFTGYAKAFDEIYKALLNRPKGLANFEKEIASFTPEIPDADYFKDGYRALTKAGVGLLYKWGYGHWLGVLSLAVLPLIATMPLAFAMPKGKEWFEKGAENADERAAFEALTLPFALNAATPLIFGGLIASVTSRGSEGITTAGLISGAVNAAFALLYLITVPAGLDPGAPWRWILLFGVPAVVGLSMTTAAIVKAAQDESRRKTLLLLYAIPFLVAGILGVLLFFFTEIVGSTAGEITWIVLAALIAVVGLILLFFVLPPTLRDTRLPEEAGAFPALRPHYVRLFDKSSLYDRPQQNDESKTETHYPSAVRPLLRLFWTGPGDFFIRPRRTHIEYVYARDGSPANIIPAPITPMSERQLAEYLQRVPLAGGKTGLNCALVFEADANVELPPGATFADHGDTTEDKADDAPEFALVEAAEEFKQLSRENTSDSYVLFHAPKRAQAVRADRLGTVPFEEREIEAVDGSGKISGSGIRISGISTEFRFFFQPGDRIVFNGQVRVVTKVESDSLIVISSAFNPAPDQGQYKRLGSADELTRGYSFIAQPRRRTGTSDTIMDLAGDIAAVICLGGTSRMLDSVEAHIADLDGVVDATNLPLVTRDIQPIQRVFRNWCLDRRLVDEWRELVVGGAMTSAAAAADPGARVLLQQGWVQTLRGWLRVVDAGAQVAPPEHTVLDPALHDGGVNGPTNLELSQAIASLLDMPAPVLVH
jgi:hypothetical protein